MLGKKFREREREVRFQILSATCVDKKNIQITALRPDQNKRRGEEWGTQKTI